MAATAAATEAAPQMMLGGENHQACVKIKITGQNPLPGGRISCAMKIRDALLADAGAVPLMFRPAPEEFHWNLDLSAPALVLASGGRTELASVQPAAHRTPRWMDHVHGTFTSTR